MKRTAFTLVEILIVVIILGILAAIVIPQFTEASNDARNSALVSDLQTMRSQVELYKVQHGERLPCCTYAADGAATADTVANTMARLTGKTDLDGTINNAGQFGPYLQRMPTNAFATANQDKLRVETLAVGTALPAADETVGWWINTTNGAVGASDAAHLDR